MKKTTRFFEKVKEDHRIWPAHISLYTALLGLRYELAATSFFPIDRMYLMSRSKIRSKNTYYKCLKDLAASGCIVYQPEYYPGKKSMVKIAVEIASPA